MKKYLYFLGVCALLLAARPASPQNLYIEVFDAETYRPVSGVRIEMRMGQSRMTFFTSPAGSVNENVPAGDYEITLSRTGFRTYEEQFFRVAPTELTSHSYFLHRETVVPDMPAGESPSLRERQFYAGLGYQIGDMPQARVSVGYYFLGRTYLQFAVSHGWQNYSSRLFENPAEKYRVVFNNLWFGVGYDYRHPLGQKMTVFGGPGLLLGLEAAANDGLFANEAVDKLVNTGIRPGLLVGFSYSRLALTFGVDYSLWLNGAMTGDRHPLENGENGEPVRWSGDLFPGRKGLCFTLGLRYFIF